MTLTAALRRTGLLLCFLVAAGSWAQDLVPVPALKAHVTDLTGSLAPDQITSLDGKLAAFEARKGSQIGVLIVPTTRPESIEQYSIRVAEQWKLGRKGVDDGALLLIAKDDRALRIEVGYGLEGALPDATANRIVEDIIVPRFKTGDFYGGIDAGVGAIVKVVDGEPLPLPQKQWHSPGKINGGNLHSLFIIGIILVFVVGGVLRSVVGRLPAAGLIGGAAGVIAWLLVSSLAAAAVAGIIAFIVTLMSSGTPGGRGGYGGWTGGGGGFGGGGGGGFSGGGGGFGGGGASGRW
jgi:uncharacterized protein